MKRFSGFSFIEILTGVMIFAVLSIPVIMDMNSTRTDTSKAINYLRGLELAQETLEWVSLIPVDSNFEMNLYKLNGSLVKKSGSGYAPVSFSVPTNRNYSNRLLRDITYPVQYDNAFFLRNVTISPVVAGPNSKRLKKVTVSIHWNEGKVPSVLDVSGLDADGARMKKIVLAILVLDKNSVD